MQLKYNFLLLLIGAFVLQIESTNADDSKLKLANKVMQILKSINDINNQMGSVDGVITSKLEMAPKKKNSNYSGKPFKVLKLPTYSVRVPLYPFKWVLENMKTTLSEKNNID